MEAAEVLAGRVGGAVVGRWLATVVDSSSDSADGRSENRRWTQRTPLSPYDSHTDSSSFPPPPKHTLNS